MPRLVYLASTALPGTLSTYGDAVSNAIMLRTWGLRPVARVGVKSRRYVHELR